MKRDLFQKPSLKKIFSKIPRTRDRVLVESLEINGIKDGAAASISGCEMQLSTKKPIVGGKPHFEGVITIRNKNGGEDKQMVIHLSTPGKDTHWYITIGDIIRYDKNGNNITPIIGF